MLSSRLDTTRRCKSDYRWVWRFLIKSLKTDIFLFFLAHSSLLSGIVFFRTHNTVRKGYVFIFKEAKLKKWISLFMFSNSENMRNVFRTIVCRRQKRLGRFQRRRSSRSKNMFVALINATSAIKQQQKKTNWKTCLFLFYRRSCVDLWLFNFHLFSELDILYIRVFRFDWSEVYLLNYWHLHCTCHYICIVLVISFLVTLDNF